MTKFDKLRKWLETTEYAEYDDEQLEQLVVIHIANNDQLTTIESDTFVGLTNLRQLHLDGNELTTINSGAFMGLDNLVKLLLTHNQLSIIKSDTFVGLNKLQYLYLNNNQISIIEPDVFAHLNKLKVLILHHNQLTTVKSDIFGGLNDLKYLYLNNNKLITIEEGAFCGLNNLEVLRLDHNPQLYNLPWSIVELENVIIELQNTGISEFWNTNKSSIVGKLKEWIMQNLKCTFYVNMEVSTSEELKNREYREIHIGIKPA